MIVSAELISLSSGLIVYWKGAGIYPSNWYPDERLNLVITQTIQITCYLVSLTGSAVAIIIIPFLRWKIFKSCQ